MKTLYLLFFQIFLLIGCATESLAQPYESSPSFRAADILDTHLQRGNNFRVQPLVSTNGYLYIFNVETNYGKFQLVGLSELKKFVYEMKVVEQLEKISTTNAVSERAGDSVVGIISAPFKAAKKVWDVVENPQSITETAQAIPDGLSRIFDSVSIQAQEGWEDINDGSISAKANSGKNDGDNVIVQGALNVAGYKKNLRKLQKAYQVDPYSRNPVLREELKRIASAQTATGFAFKFVPGFNIGLVGKASGYITDAEEIALYEAPEVVKKNNKDLYKKWGLTEEEEKNFRRNPYYSLSDQAILAQSLKKLDINNDSRREYLRLAATSENYQFSTFYTRVIAELAAQQSVRKIKSLVVLNKLPIFIDQSKQKALIYLPLDILIWSEHITLAFDSLPKYLRDRYQTKSMLVEIPGKLSRTTKNNLKAKGIMLKYNGLF